MKQISTPSFVSGVTWRGLECLFTLMMKHLMCISIMLLHSVHQTLYCVWNLSEQAFWIFVLLVFANYLTTWLNYYANLYLEKFSFSQPIRSLISQIATSFEPCHFEFTYQDHQSAVVEIGLIFSRLFFSNFVPDFFIFVHISCIFRPIFPIFLQK